MTSLKYKLLNIRPKQAPGFLSNLVESDLLKIFQHLCNYFQFVAFKLTVHSMLRGIVNHSNSNSESQIESQVESQVERDWNMRHNRLSGTNRYEVLENYDEVENEKLGTSIKSVT